MGLIEEREERTKWFMQDRFGMFIHWGLYAIPGRGEWVHSDEQITRVYIRNILMNGIRNGMTR